MLSAIIFTAPFFPFDGLKAQKPFEQWLSPHAVQAHYKQGRSVVDADIFIYQAGATINDDGLYEAMLTKIDRSGELIWSYTYSAPSGGQAWFTDVMITPGGMVALSGVALNASQTASTSLAAMLEPSIGDLYWIDSYSHPGSIYNGAASISADDNSIYVAGLTYNMSTLSDMLVMKYDGYGNVEWVEKKDFFDMEDAAVKLVYTAGEVMVTGAAQYNANSWHFGTLKFDAGDGALMQTYVSGNSMSGIDAVRDMVLDASGNIYVTGSEITSTQGVNMYTAKLSPSLQLLWDRSYNYSGANDDRANSIALLSTGQVLITGYSDFGGGNTQFTSVMYSSAGASIGSLGYDISAKGDTALAVTTDATGNVYVGGTFYNGSNQDVKTIKYSNMGVLKWEIDYNGIDNGDDTVLDMVHDGTDLIVMVQSQTADDRKEYRAIKYSESDFESPQYEGSSHLRHAFSRNNGQVTNEFGDPVTDIVPYYARSNGSFYRQDGIDYLSASLNGDSTLNDTIQKVALDFYEMQSGARMAAFDRSAYFENHYVPHAPHKLERIPHYGRLLYMGLWEDVDMETRFGQGQEFSFRVGKKGRISSIAFEVQGADDVFINGDGDAVLRSFNRDVVLPSPRVYQANSSGQLVELGWSPYFTYINGILRIDGSGSIDGSKDMWVRISRGDDDIPQTDGFCHSTYFGGFSDDTIWDSVADLDGNIIACGTSGNIGFYIATDYLYLAPIINSTIAEIGYVVKFDRDFVPQYLSAFNGNARLGFHAIDVNSEGNIYCAGPTRATNLVGQSGGINIINAAFHQPLPTTTNPNANNSFITYLNGSNGQTLWASYFGGNKDNYSSPVPENVILDIAVDHNDRLLITGTAADRDFPLRELEGHYFNDAAGDSPSFFARFTSEVDLEWCTYIGGSGIDIATAIDVSKEYNRFAISGITSSVDFDLPIVSNTYQKLTMTGSSDWFLCEFSFEGSMIWGTFEGSDADELISFEFPAKNIAYNSSGGLFFAYNTTQTNGLNFIGSIFEPPTNPFGAFAALVEFEHGFYNPLWRTLLMGGDGFRNKSNYVSFKGNKLFVGGEADDTQMEIVQAHPNLYAEGKATPAFVANDGFVMIFEPISRSLLHSTYFGGTGGSLPFTSVLTLAFNDFNEMFGFGSSRTRYIDQLAGIPVKNNGVQNAYFQPNKGGVLNNFDGFGFSMCFEDTPLNAIDIEVVASLNRQICHVFPNPISIRSGTDISFQCSTIVYGFRLYSIDGKLISSSSLFNDRTGLMSIGSGNVESGFYLLVIDTEQGAETVKVVITK